MKKICREQYEKDFDEMFKLDKTGLMTDVDCYVSILQEKANKYDKLLSDWNKLEEWLKEYLQENPISFEDWDEDVLYRRNMVEDILSKMQEIQRGNSDE